MCFSTQLEDLIEKEIEDRVNECFETGEALERAEDIFAKRVKNMDGKLGKLGKFSREDKKLKIRVSMSEEPFEDIDVIFNIHDLIDEEISGVFYKGEEQEKYLTYYRDQFNLLSEKINNKLKQGC